MWLDVYRTLIVLYLCLILCDLVHGLKSFLPKTLKADYIGDVEVQVKEETNRFRRSADGVSVPSENIDLSLIVNDHNVDIHLHRNNEIQDNVPVYTMGNNGVVSPEYVPHQNNAFYYQSVQHSAAFFIETNDISSCIFGSFRDINEEYFLEPKEQDCNYTSSTSPVFHLLKIKFPRFEYADKGLTSPSEESKYRIKNDDSHRVKRQTPAYQIEMLLIVDYSIYSYWITQSNASTTSLQDQDAKANIRRFYAWVITGMDVRYKNIQTSDYTISIVYGGIYIANAANKAPFTENIKNTATTPNQVDVTTALNDVTSWVKSTPGLPDHDHAMMFSRYDFTNSGSTSNAGLAWVGQVCKTNSVSVVEDHFDFVILTVAAHELGHSLSAAHDGTGNACNANDAFIMAPSSGPIDGTTNPWIFSTCSTTYFTTYINQLNSENNNCMTTLSASFDPTALAQYNNTLPGEVYDADAQCRHIMGSGSSLCKWSYNSNFSSICTSLWCHKTDGSGQCQANVGSDGLLCGNKKWCISGVCTYDERAPEGDESCLYGDRSGVVITFNGVGKTCSEQDILGTTAICYQSSVNTGCCKQCAKVYTGRTGCEYGDKANGCTLAHCPSHPDVCCGTCYTPTTTTTVPTTTMSTTASTTTTVPTTTMSTTASTTTTVPTTTMSTTASTTTTTPVPTTTSTVSITTTSLSTTTTIPTTVHTTTTTDLTTINDSTTTSDPTTTITDSTTSTELTTDQMTTSTDRTDQTTTTFDPSVSSTDPTTTTDQTMTTTDSRVDTDSTTASTTTTPIPTTSTAQITTSFLSTTTNIPTTMHTTTTSASSITTDQTTTTTDSTTTTAESTTISTDQMMTSTDEITTTSDPSLTTTGTATFTDETMTTADSTTTTTDSKTTTFDITSTTPDKTATTTDAALTFDSTTTAFPASTDSKTTSSITTTKTSNPTTTKTTDLSSTVTDPTMLTTDSRTTITDQTTNTYEPTTTIDLTTTGTNPTTIFSDSTTTTTVSTAASTVPTMTSTASTSSTTVPTTTNNIPITTFLDTTFTSSEIGNITTAPLTITTVDINTTTLSTTSFPVSSTSPSSSTYPSTHTVSSEPVTYTIKENNTMTTDSQISTEKETTKSTTVSQTSDQSSSLATTEQTLFTTDFTQVTTTVDATNSTTEPTQSTQYKSTSTLSSSPVSTYDPLETRTPQSTFTTTITIPSSSTKADETFTTVEATTLEKKTTTNEKTSTSSKETPNQTKTTPLTTVEETSETDKTTQLTTEEMTSSTAGITSTKTVTAPQTTIETTSFIAETTSKISKTTPTTVETTSTTDKTTSISTEKTTKLSETTFTTLTTIDTTSEKDETTQTTTAGTSTPSKITSTIAEKTTPETTSVIAGTTLSITETTSTTTETSPTATTEKTSTTTDISTTSSTITESTSSGTTISSTGAAVSTSSKSSAVPSTAVPSTQTSSSTISTTAQITSTATSPSTAVPSTTVASTTTTTIPTTTTTITTGKERRFIFIFTLVIVITQDLSDSNQYAIVVINAQIALTRLYRRRLGSRFRRCRVRGVRRGSLVIDHEVFTEDVPAASSEIVSVAKDLYSGKDNITYDGKEANVSAVTYTDTSGNNITVNTETSACQIFEASGSCSSGYKCIETTSGPACGPITDEYEIQKMIIIGAAVGGVSLICIIAIVLVLCLCCKKSDKKISRATGDGPYGIVNPAMDEHYYNKERLNYSTESDKSIYFDNESRGTGSPFYGRRWYPEYNDNVINGSWRNQPMHSVKYFIPRPKY